MSLRIGGYWYLVCKRLGVLLNILQCTQPHNKNYCAPSVNSTELGKACLTLVCIIGTLFRSLPETRVVRLGQEEVPTVLRSAGISVPAAKAHTVVAAPACFRVGRFSHLCGTVSLDVAHAA